MSEGYNGYSNYQTWNVVLWIFNEESLYRYWMERKIYGNLPDELQLWAEENTPVVTGLYADLLGYALGMVDWHEVATAIREAD
ncbi:hypothetical protein GZ77_26375 [Endozoicomonas montiporae]|uniref:Uncharacterized protein n=1 Tax=Endozoicomonas montiporae TaxID=1027273 RepID=A0A081MYK4_9GAMM|nr:hypothetical protein [Endozoicomonas montiporae]KEQ11277.1 hypothetical protein GZ77_26375 [Endozoicomonas montiporae]